MTTLFERWVWSFQGKFLGALFCSSDDEEDQIDPETIVAFSTAEDLQRTENHPETIPGEVIFRDPEELKLLLARSD